MKLTKRMQNAIIQGAIANLIFCIILSTLVGVYILPKIRNIQDLQKELITLSDTLTQLQNTGILYQDFLSTTREKSLDNDPYLANILKSTDQSFYESTFSSTGSSDYNGFLQTLKERLLAEKTSAAYIEKDQLLNKILPFYSGTNKNTQEGLNDFFFINYIEQLMYSFQLTAEGDIGIGTLQKVEAEKKGGTKENTVETQEADTLTLSEDIYSLPLSFDVTGQKSDIVDFIHFFENVGSIELKGDTLSIYTDTFTTKVLNTASSKENLYENQVADIKKITFDSYPDSSPFSTSYTPLVSLMKTAQAKETFTVHVDLNFYVAGAPLYRLQQYIQKVQTELDSFLEKIQQDEQKMKSLSTLDNQARSTLQSFKNTSLSLKTELDTLKKAIDTGTVDRVYDTIAEYEGQILQIQDLYSRKVSISLEK